MMYELMQSRRSVRRFKPEMPDRRGIERLLEAAITAPSASNKQPWRFLVVTNPAVITRMAAAVREAVDHIARHIEGACQPAFRAYGDYFTRFEAAPAVIVPLFSRLTVLSNLVDEHLDADARERIAVMEHQSGLIGVALAMQNVMLMAPELGLGTSGMTGPLVASHRLRDILEVAPSWDIAALVPVGVPAESPAPTARKPLSQVVRWIE
jgi:nitroreductase